MQKIVVRALETALVQAWRAGGPDAHGQAALAMPAQGTGNPCRHCLGLIAEAVAYVHIRSKFNCFQCRVERA